MNFNKFQLSSNIMTICFLFLLLTAELVMSQTPTAPVAEKVDTTVGITKVEPTTPSIPSEIKVPDGYTFSFVLYGDGTIVYTCVVASTRWDLTSVNANLINRDDSHFDPAFYVATLSSNTDGTLIFKSVLAKHDNSTLTVKRDTKVTSPNNSSKLNADWERYAAVKTESGGSFSDIGYVVVVDTNSGAPRAVSQCGNNFQDGGTDTTPFTATYYFYSGAIPSTTTTDNSPNNSGTMNSIFIGNTQLGLILIIGFITIGVVSF
ncbi:hypothetical protein Glove_197g76 [Diversispora epigaea]|uniref:DOMON domain-containing protein n=1 Tax=Diversispora epigaea TaxID=1348612 RepID=A0A397ITK4_9GLOM|nr:hypothetical protein Glove_197g76 [Diversispora epigaea]